MNTRKAIGIVLSIVTASIFTALAVNAQGTYTITTPTGTITQPLLPGGGQSLEVRHRNGSGSDPWGLASQPAGTPIAFHEWRIDAPPGYVLLMGGLFGARQLGPSSFLMASATDYKVPARRNGVDIYPATAQYHRIFPGDTLWARVVPASDPWEVGYIDSVLTPERRAAGLAVMAYDDARIAKYPWLGKVVDSYTFDASCINVSTPLGKRGPGWLLVPFNFATRWPSGGFVAGSISWVPSAIPLKAGHQLKPGHLVRLSAVEEFNGTVWTSSSLNGKLTRVMATTATACSLDLAPAQGLVRGGTITRDPADQARDGHAHWYGLGSRSAVPGENENNEHYRAAACFGGKGLRDHDYGAIATWLYLLRSKCAYGQVNTDVPHLDQGKWRNEKGDLARGTTGTRPSRAKGFSRDLAMAHAAGFTAEEPLLARAVMLDMGSLLGPEWSWNGSGGARMLGHYLEDLYDYWIATSDDRFRARAAVEINHAMAIVGAKPYFVDDPAHEKVSGGEGLCALASCRRWALHGAGAQHQAKLDQMLAWYESHLYSGGLCAYYAVVNADGTVTWQATAEFGSLNWLHVPGLSATVHDGIANHLFKMYVNQPNVDATYGAQGPSWGDKWWPWIAGYGGTKQ